MAYPLTEFAVAAEDSPGAGTYGAFETAGTASAGPDGRARLRLGPVANDGRTYMIKARHVADGWTPSAYTEPVIVDPWASLIPPDPSLEATFTTGDDETVALPNSRQWEDGDGTLVDKTVAGKISINLDAETLEGFALGETTDTVPIQLSGIGGSVEWDGLLTGGLALQYSVDAGDTWPFFTQAAAAAYALGDGPFVSLEAGDVREGDWATMVTESRTNVLWRLVQVETDGTVTAIDGTDSAKVCAGYKYVRLIADVGTAGTVVTDPITKNLHAEFAAVAELVADPPPDPDPPEASDGCSGLPIDSYPVARALIWRALCDCGTYSSDGSGLDNVDTLTDLSGNSNTLSAVAGADVKRNNDGAPIPQLNGRDPVSFHDAQLAFPTTLFDGMTEGEWFMVVKGAVGDPGTNSRTYFCVLGPSDDAEWSRDTGGGADTGEIREDFGSTVLHATGDVTGALDDWRIYNVRAAAGHYTIAVDGVVEYTNPVNTVAFSVVPRLGNRGNNSHFHFVEGAIHSSLLTTEERALVFAKLQERWAL